MAVAFRSAGTFTFNIGNCVPPMPAGFVANDILLLVVQSCNEAITIPAPYQELLVGANQAAQGTGTAATAGSVRAAIGWLRATGSETAPTVQDTGDHTCAQLFAFSGATTGVAPFSAQALSVVSTTSTSVTFPAVTTPDPNAMVVLIEVDAIDTTTAQMSGQTNANLTSLTEQADLHTTTNLGGGLSLTTGVMASAGNTGTTTATLGITSKQIVFTLALTDVARLVLTPTGQVGTGSPGTPTPGTSRVATGQFGTSARGTLTATRTLTATGAQATGAVGTLIEDIAVGLTGAGATGALGTLTPAQPDVTLALTGQAGAGAVGTLTPSSDAATIIGLTGLQAAGAVGTLTATQDILAALAGVQASAAIGSLTTSQAVLQALTGVEAASQLGTLTAVLGQITLQPITGLAASASLGAVRILINRWAELPCDPQDWTVQAPDDQDWTPLTPDDQVWTKRSRYTFTRPS